MKVVVFGGSGRVGSRIVARFQELGHDVVVPSRRDGVDLASGQGLDAALAGADVVVDATNNMSFEPGAFMAFFRATATNLVQAAGKAGVSHLVVLSIVGTDLMQDSPYLQAKLAQEQVILGSDLPHTIVRLTQFHEFVGSIADGATEGETIRLPRTAFQPVAADDAAAIVARAALGTPVNGIVEGAGPERESMAAFVREYLATQGDQRQVVEDDHAQYFGANTGAAAMVPAGPAELGTLTFRDWLARQQLTVG